MTATLKLRDENGNVYEIPALVGKKGDKGDTGSQGEKGEQGIQGLKGDKGTDGASFAIQGIYPTLLALQTAHPNGSVGDAYAVGTQENNVIYNWSTTTNQWFNLGTPRAHKAFKVSKVSKATKAYKASREFPDRTGLTTSVNGVAHVNGAITITQDNIPDGTNNKAYTSTEKTKLAGIATGATKNASDADLKNRANHTGTQAANTINGLADVATSGSYNDLSNKPEASGGKRVVRFVIGLSAGWTAADCDYLCDGTADQTEINAAITSSTCDGWRDCNLRWHLQYCRKD